MPWKIKGNRDPEKGPVEFIFEGHSDPYPAYRKLIYKPFALQPGFYLYQDPEAKDEDHGFPILFKKPEVEPAENEQKVPEKRNPYAPRTVRSRNVRRAPPAYENPVDAVLQVE